MQLAMEPFQEKLQWLLLAAALSLAAGGAAMALHGLLRWLGSSRSVQPPAECVPPNSLKLCGVAVFGVLLLSSVTTVPWEWLGTLSLLTAVAPALLAWLGPPDEHVEASGLQIGKGSALSHYYGYWRLMRVTPTQTGEEDNSARARLEGFQRDNPARLPQAALDSFFTTAVMVLAPTDGEYPDGLLSSLREGVLDGVGKSLGCLKAFKSPVGGNQRTYGAFSVHTVTSSNGCPSRCVALDMVGALGTLRKLREHAPAGFHQDDCQKQTQDMIKEMESIVSSRGHLRGQVKVVRYQPDEHVGDAILAALSG